ncbi:hypothetical protein STEG23_035256 [Scotinomys teguina]
MFCSLTCFEQELISNITYRNKIIAKSVYYLGSSSIGDEHCTCFSDPFPNSPSFPDQVKATRLQPPRSSAFIYKRSFLLCAGPTIVPVRLVRLATLLTTVLDSYHSRRRSPYATCLPVQATSCAAPRPRPAGTRHDTRILLWQLTRSFIGYSFFMHSGSSRFSRFSFPEPVQQLLSYGFSTQLTPRGLLP